MSYTMPLQEAAARLAELVGELKPGDEIVLTEQDRPVARIVPDASVRPRPRRGRCKGMLTILAEDDTFDCVEMKRRGAEYVYNIIKDMTPEQEVEYWRQRTEEIRREQERLRAQPSPDPATQACPRP